MFRLSLKSEDELFHVSLYDWLFSMNMTDKLLEVFVLFRILFILKFEAELFHASLYD